MNTTGRSQREALMTREGFVLLLTEFMGGRMTRRMTSRFGKTHDAVLRAYNTLSLSVTPPNAKLYRAIFRET